MRKYFYDFLILVYNWLKKGDGEFLATAKDHCVSFAKFI